MSRPGPPVSAAHVAEALARAAEAAGQELAVVDGPRRVDYATLQRLAAGAAAAMQAQGLAPGDRVLLHLEQSLEAVVGLYGCWLAGGVAVPASAVLRARQVAYLAEHAEAAQLWTVPRLAAGLDPATTAALPPRDLAALVQELLATPAATDTTRGAPDSPDDPAAILYTSGSTGPPKGIVLSHGNLIAGARIVSGYLRLRSDDRILSLVPFSFDYGLNQLLDAVQVRATLVLQRSALPADVCRTLERQRITVLAGVPPFWVQLMEGRSPFPQRAFPDLRLITSTGGLFPQALADRYREQLPHLEVVRMYGLTEAFRSTWLPAAELDAHPDSIGRAIPECEVLVLDEDGRPCAPGTAGELVHRGPTVSWGYWRDAEATARVFRPDPDPEQAHRDAAGRPRPVVHSGDLVVADEAGYLRFVARMDETIKTLGYRVSPTEVEELAVASDVVLEAVAGGVPDPTLGAAIHLHVVPRHPQDFHPDDLRAWFREQAPRYLWPAEVQVHDAFPRTAHGKIDRTAILA
jgi:acyl-CoA synthetase (AMP-forming)/AMP-acid ligase II